MSDHESPSAPFMSGHSLAQATTILLAACIVVDLIAIAGGYSHILAVAKEVTAPLGGAAPEKYNSFEFMVLMIQIAVYFVTGLVFMIWVYRAFRNLPSLGVHNPRFSPGWAVGWFFVPILNLVRPYEVMQALWRDSNPDVGISDRFFEQHKGRLETYSSKTRLIGLWWAFVIIAALAYRASAMITANSTKSADVVTGSWISLISDGLWIGAAAVLGLIVRGIEARQEEKWRRMTIEAA